MGVVVVKIVLRMIVMWDYENDNDNAVKMRENARIQSVSYGFIKINSHCFLVIKYYKNRQRRE